jgi:hypothetical protein
MAFNGFESAQQLADFFNESKSWVYDFLKQSRKESRAPNIQDLWNIAEIQRQVTGAGKKIYEINIYKVVTGIDDDPKVASLNAELLTANAEIRKLEKENSYLKGKLEVYERLKENKS